MPKSKVRGGAKAHRRKVKTRNNRIRGEMKRQSKMFQDAMMEQIEALRNMTGETENSEVTTDEQVKLNTDGFVQSAENL
jgi:hypothetical protein